MKGIVTFVSTSLLVFASCKPVQQSSAGTKASRYEDSAATSGGPITMKVTMNNSSMECRLSNRAKAMVLANLKDNPPIPAISSSADTEGENLSATPATQEAQDNLLLCSKDWESWLLQTIGNKQFAPINVAQVALPIGGIEYGLQLGMAGATACGRTGDAALGAALLATLKYAEKRGWVCQR
jgi:hypothetical protein